ncbi:MAG TPA: universal stress protein [Acidimicrobiales bacterium]|nr:universal stress protein [Acidimicrobiales bacterium]
MAGDVVLGFDGSAGAQSALGVAVTLARALGAPLAIVFGYEPNPMGGETSDFQNQLKRLGEGFVHAAATEARRLDRDVIVEPIVVGRRPVDALLETATERAARLIVVGSMGELPIVGAILGSVPHKLLHRSRIPVLVVPRPD